MLADPLTKPLSETLMNSMLDKMGFLYKEGKHELAMQYAIDVEDYDLALDIVPRLFLFFISF